MSDIIIRKVNIVNVVLYITNNEKWILNDIFSKSTVQYFDLFGCFFFIVGLPKCFAIA